MDNMSKYIKVFCDSFDISKDQLDDLKYQDIDSWDSVGHMGLISTIEDVFNITLDSDDIIDFSSFAKGKDILKKYNVDLW